MKIVRLQAENIKGLKRIDIKPSGAMVRITGKNAAGKTSAIDCIPMALGGKRTHPPAPIRKGAKKARIEIDLGEMLVEQTISPKGSYLKISAPDGKAIGSPQTVLDKTVGDLSFDPLAFARMDGKKQGEVLRQLAGLDLTDLQKREDELGEERRIATREGKTLVARLDSMPSPAADLPQEPIDTAALQEAARQGAEHNEDIAQAIQYAAGIEKELAEAQRAFDYAKNRLADAKSKTVAAEQAVAKLGKTVDVSGIMDSLGAAHATNKAIDNVAAFLALTDEVLAARNTVRQLNSDMESVRDDRALRIAEAEYPLPGLSVSDDGDVIFSGVPLAQASQAEMTIISASIAMSLNPDLRLMLIRDGSLLDSDSADALEALAVEKGYQIFVEQVAERDENGHAPAGFFLEDGELAAVDGEEL